MLRESPDSVGNEVLLRKPRAEDGVHVWDLVQSCSPPLDANSVYCNLLQCTHYSDTCVVAEKENTIIGWLSGYRLPADNQIIFIWQICIHERARRCGLGKKMIQNVLSRDHSIKKIQATITPNNKASWQLFRSFASQLSLPFSSEILFHHEHHFGRRGHESEFLVTIGPHLSESS
uniref:L-2,4-diaminobutyric acid acetyltransferase n=1 Tax=Aureoumbra lagunensis TaxID=44058 RepID=A0A7S3NLP3_9STRA|mmetsp:Transcript_7713/g.10733  ORF Transcript_7713/g.10733 Transcript_7713/m.10733 type:complete len:175 (-) Transcript_7713:99-623(-)